MTARRFAIAGQRIVVTGAAHGIGRATALALAARGAQLELCDVDVASLDQTGALARAAGAPAVHTMCVDVADKGAVAAFAAAVQRRGGAPNVLVNNAGVALAGGFLATRPEDWEWLLGVNLLGVVHCTREFLPAMIAERKPGRVINVASMAGFVNSSALVAYGTTKAALIGLSEGLREELAPHDIGVSAVCPGFVDSTITEHMRVGAGADPGVVRSQAKQFYRRWGTKPERVARAVIRAIERNPAVLPVPESAVALYWLKRLLPGGVSALVRWIRQPSAEQR